MNFKTLFELKKSCFKKLIYQFFDLNLYIWKKINDTKLPITPNCDRLV